VKFEDCPFGQVGRASVSFCAPAHPLPNEMSPPLQIDPNCIQEAPLQPHKLKTDDSRQISYAAYDKEATQYDTTYIKKYNDDLSTALLYAGITAAVSSSIATRIDPKHQSYPNDQSALLLREILLALDDSNASPPNDPPPNELVIATTLLYASLIISMLAAFVAMLGKQWLNRYLWHNGGSMVERRADRQLKCDGLKKWCFRFFIRSPRLLLILALLLLACGLCEFMKLINTTVAYTFIILIGPGVLFYTVILMAGALPYSCPFQI